MDRLRAVADITDQEVLRVLEDVDERGGTAPFTPHEKRSAYRAAVVRSGPPQQVAVLKDESTSEGVRVRTYSPASEDNSLPRMLYIHGGGFLSGDFETHDPICRMLANGTGHRVTAVEYRVAPENPFPAAVDDCFSALQWLSAGSTSPIAVMGDSAGGNLAAVMALRAREAGIPLAAQILIYPMLDALLSSPSLVSNGLIPPFTLLDCVQAWQWYLPSAETSRTHPDVSPLHARDLGGLPRTMVLTAGFDILRDEALTYVERLRKSGTTVRHEHYPEMVHGFFQWTGQVTAARKAVEQVIEFLRTV